MRVHWGWVLIGVGVGYWVVPKIVPKVTAAKKG
jgi:hypothetical protein